MAYDFSQWQQIATDPRLMAQAAERQKWAQDAAQAIAQQQTAQQVAQEAAQPAVQPAQPTPPPVQPVAQQPVSQPALQPVDLHPEAVPTLDSNGLAASAAKVLTPLDDAGRSLASQIANFKMKYAAAEKAGDTEGMKAAHTGAQALRDAAASFGMDPERLGANQSYDQLMASLSADYAKGVSDIANMLSPQEYYQQQYQQNLANGMSRRHAQASALDATEAYEGRYKRELGNAFTRYGVNDAGEMNRMGAMIANLMYGNNPQSVALYDQYYANPMQQWKFNKNMEVQDKLYGQKVDFGQHQFDWNRALNNDKFNFQLRLQANQFDFQKTMAEMQQAFAKATREEQIALAKENPQLFMMLHGGKNAQGTGLSKPEMTTAQSLKNSIDQAAQSVENAKVREEDGKAVEDARALMEKLYSEGKIDKDTYTTAYDRISQLNAASDRKWQRYNYADKIPE